MNQLSTDQESRILVAWNELKTVYYITGEGYLKPPTGKKVPDTGLTPDSSTKTIGDNYDVPYCVSASPDNWSDLMAHYYAFTPTYSPDVFPNVRECFTYLAASFVTDKSGKNRTMNYHETYDYCSFVPVDRVDLNPNGKLINHGGHYNGDIDKYFPSLETTEFTSKNAAGPLKWIREHQDDVFKFIMLGELNPAEVDSYQGGIYKLCTIDPRFEQKLINQFYGIDLKGKFDYTSTDKEQVAECLSKRPIRKMKNVDGFTLDPLDGTQCSYDLRKKYPLAVNCYE